MGTVTAQDVEAEDALELVVEENVNDDAEANVGKANRS